MRSMFGIRYKPDAEILRPFRAWVSWLCHFIGLHPMLMYYTPSGLILQRALRSPEGAAYANDGHSPSDKKKKSITSPEGARYNSEAVSPLAYNSQVASPLAIKKRQL
jgi:hypothetical protein